MGFECLSQESPGKTEMHWSHLMALGGGGREGNAGDENGVLYSLLRCRLAQSPASPTAPPLPGPAATAEHHAVGVRLTVCHRCGSLLERHRAVAKSACCLCCPESGADLFSSLSLNILNYKRFPLVLMS